MLKISVLKNSLAFKNGLAFVYLFTSIFTFNKGHIITHQISAVNSKILKETALLIFRNVFWYEKASIYWTTAPWVLVQSKTDSAKDS